MEAACGGVRSLCPLELKALSVPFGLRFLLGVDFDVVMCVTAVRERKCFSLKFPKLSNAFKELLQLCAVRYSMSCEHLEECSYLRGTPVMPTLRYIDYIPGALHPEEVLECLGVERVQKPKRQGNLRNEFVACFINYEDHQLEAAIDPLGNGLYLTFDYGLATATHSHLIEIRFHKGWDVDAALREFEEFSRLKTRDVRFINENNRGDGGVLVMPSIQDAADLFERYEDEDSDDEGELLPFVLRPLAPMVPVPSVEDSTLRKHREQYWKEIELFWQRFPKWRNTVVVSNLYDGATLHDVLQLFDGLAIAKATMVECRTPARRHKIYVTFETSDLARAALASDSLSTKGKTLRVQVSPPFLDEQRRGNVIETLPMPASPPSVRGKVGLSGGPSSPDGAPVETGGSRRERKAVGSTSRETKAAATTTSGPPAGNKEAAPLSEVMEHRPPVYTTPKLNPQTAEATHPNPSPVSTTMNANAKEFVPSSTLHTALSTPNAYLSPVALVCVSEAPASPPAYSLHGAALLQDTSLCVLPPPPPYTPPPPYSFAALDATAVFPSHILPPPPHSM